MNGLESRSALVAWAWIEATALGKWRLVEDLRARGKAKGSRVRSGEENIWEKKRRACI